MFPTADTEDIVQVTSQNTGASSDVQNASENTQIAKQQSSRDLTLNMLVKEMVFCIALALTTYGALHNSPTKVSKHPQAMRFFNSDSVVIDWYKGQLSNARSVINTKEVSFVMYYAPWDAESQHVRGEFEKAASVLNDRVHFAAINCWNPGSECRLHHNKIPAWPILMVYTVTSRGILYKGPMDAHSMVKFLELIMHPLERVASTDDLVSLLSFCDAVAIGYTPLAHSSKYYNIWYYVALKAREFDTIGEICFATVTSEELAGELGVDIVPNARLMLWNDTKDYITEEAERPWNESSLLQWVLENFTQPVARIIPIWKKSFSFEKYADGNPILILFTPLNPLYEQLPSYSLLREVAMEYYNCNNNETNQWISELVKLQQVQRLLYQQRDLAKYCKEFKFRKTKNARKFDKEVISSNNKYPWNNVTQRNSKAGSFNALLKRRLAVSNCFDGSNDESRIVSGLPLLNQCETTALPDDAGYCNFREQCERTEDIPHPKTEYSPHFGTSMMPSEDDPLSTENLVQTNVKHFCKIFKFANDIGDPVTPAVNENSSDDHNNNMTNVQGIACGSNATMHILALDSVRNHHFAEFLGIDITKKRDMTAVIILDNKLESQYVLSEEYSAKSIRDFIYNFTQSTLKRSLRTHVEEATHTHYFGSGGPAVPSDVVEVVNLNIRTFRRLVRTPGTLSIVAVCGGACTASMSRALIEASRLLTGCGLRVLPAKLDALRHDLPWHYTADHYPTVFVFPADRNREAESRSYPSSERITSSGLVALALRSLGALQHLRARLALCASTRLSAEKKTCLKEMREHVMMVIARNLKYWRRSEDKKLKDALLRRLQHLHKVSFTLNLLHITDLDKKSETQKLLLNSLDDLSKHWNIEGYLLRKNETSKTKVPTS